MEKKLVGLFVCMLLIGTCFVINLDTVSADLVDGDYTYTLSGNPLVATITGYTGAGGAIKIPRKLGGYPTVHIGDEVFCENYFITSVIIPNSVVTIGGAAFLGCTSLTSVNIPNSVTTIGDHAFYGCTSLTSVAIPNSVITIRTWAFFDCSSLASVTIGNNVTTIERSTFEGCSALTSVTFGDSVTKIGYAAFAGCSSLTSIIIPDDVTTLDNYAFAGCHSLTSIIIPDSVTFLRLSFMDCTSLTSVSIGNGLTNIGYFAFAGCTALTSVTIGSGVTSISPNAFGGCSSLTSITFLGLVAPTMVWGGLEGTPTTLRGHAYAASNFPPPGEVWSPPPEEDGNELTMGAYLVDIDIKPGAYPNTISTKTKGQLSVDVLTGRGFDATTLDVNTVMFLGDSPDKISYSDVDYDGDIDLVLKFNLQELDFSLLVTETGAYPYAYLTGEMYSGYDIQGKDTVRLKA